jgi:hypothetical protein
MKRELLGQMRERIILIAKGQEEDIIRGLE